MLSFKRTTVHGNHYHCASIKTKAALSLQVHHEIVQKHVLGCESEESRESTEASEGAEVPQHLADYQCEAEIEFEQHRREEFKQREVKFF